MEEKGSFLFFTEEKELLRSTTYRWLRLQFERNARIFGIWSNWFNSVSMAVIFHWATTDVSPYSESKRTSIIHSDDAEQNPPLKRSRSSGLQCSTWSWLCHFSPSSQVWSLFSPWRSFFIVFGLSIVLFMRLCNLRKPLLNTFHENI